MFSYEKQPLKDGSVGVVVYEVAENGRIVTEEKRIKCIVREEVEALISEINWDNHEKVGKPIFVRLENDSSGSHDIRFRTRKEAADYCYKIGLENVFDIGTIIFGHPRVYICSHLLSYAERIKELDKELKRWKSGKSDG